MMFGGMNPMVFRAAALRGQMPQQPMRQPAPMPVQQPMGGFGGMMGQSMPNPGGMMRPMAPKPQQMPGPMAPQGGNFWQGPQSY